LARFCISSEEMMALWEMPKTVTVLALVMDRVVERVVENGHALGHRRVERQALDTSQRVQLLRCEQPHQGVDRADVKVIGPGDERIRRYGNPGAADEIRHLIRGERGNRGRREGLTGRAQPQGAGDGRLGLRVGDSGGRQRLLELVVKRLELRDDGLILLADCAEYVRDGRRHLVAGRRRQTRGRSGRGGAGGTERRTNPVDLGRDRRQQLRLSDHIRHRPHPFPTKDVDPDSVR
jgi:hypothetical protein